MMNNIKDNLGNRTSGRIGSRPVDSVVLDAMNLAIPHTVIEAQPDYYNREASIAVLTNVRDYPLPTVDVDSDTIRIKDIYSHRMYRTDGTDVLLKHLSYLEFIKRTSDYALNITGTPSFYALWGKTNKLTFDYVPSENFTLTLYVEVYPQPIVTGNLSGPLPIDDQWSMVVEAYATKHCYLKMQQTEMYQFWDELYNREKASISRQENKKQNDNVSVQGTGAHINDPLNNPFVRNWNN
jgi:hypothetical protein